MNSLFGNWASSLRRNSLPLVLSMLLPTFGLSNSVMAAEQIYASYSALEISIPVSVLENYAKTGIINDNLADFQQYLALQKLQKLRQVLLKPVKITPEIVSQFLYTTQGEFLLGRLIEVIETKPHQLKSKLNALRSAIISASDEPEGLTLLNLLRKYPTQSIHIDLAYSLGMAAELEKLINETNRAIAALKEKSDTEAAISGINSSPMPDLQTQGKFQAIKHTVKFYDWKRSRTLLTDLYIPNVQRPASVIVISHGLGLDSSNFQYLASYLASYGFAVVVPNHPGSSTKQLKSLQDDSVNELAQPSEFIDQPLDIKYILDELEKLNQSDERFQQRLNLQQVGVFGQSFGGYTALALAGAKLNFEQLEQDCQPEALKDTWNMSLLLQCRALELKVKKSGIKYNLSDERVKAAIAVNPITSSIFGKAGLSQVKIPIMVVGSSEDTVAPALFEQILPFSWFANAHKYLVMLVGGTHFSTIGNSNPGSKQLALPAEMVGNAPQARRYMNVLSLPFFQAYVAKRPEYVPCLQAAHIKSIASKSLGLSIVQSLSQKELAQISDTQIPEANPINKKVPNKIIRFGLWVLDMGVSLLHVMIFP